MCVVWQKEFDVFLARGKDLVVNGLLKEQGIKDIIGDRKLEEDGKHECDQCQRKHERVRYEYDKCEYKATCKSDITKHKQAKHEGVKYECSVNTTNRSYKVKA